MTKQAYKKLKKQNRKNYRLSKKALKQEYRSNKEKEVKTIDMVKNQGVPKRSILEEIGNAVTHIVGCAMAIAGCVLLLVKAKTASEYVGYSIYSAGLILMFLMSALYHAFPYGSTVKRVFRRFDYSSIYLLIGATFSPILLCYVGKTLGLVFLIIQWVIILIGITFLSIFGPSKLKGLHFTLYILIGWSGLIFLPKMVTDNMTLFIFILLGGIVYSLGIIPFAIDKKVSHFIWHFFVLFGAAIQWIGIFVAL